MPKFLFVYRRASDAKAKITPEDLQLGSEKWHEWIKQGMEKGWLLDPGDALTQEGRVLRANHIVVDGPFIESKEVVGGYSLIQADSMDAAVELASTCPVMLFGASVEVRCLAGFTKM